MLDDNIRSIDELKKFIKIEPEIERRLQKVIDKHPMNISRYYLSLIDKNDPDDPIKKMIVPSIDELNTSGMWDTSGEQLNTKEIGLQHKYPETALILATHRCAAYCRYCFRKRLVGLSRDEILSNFDRAVDYISQHKEINNCLISGGDPFILHTEIIEKFLERLNKLPHLRFIRFGSRVPVTCPTRITDDSELPALLKRYSVKTKRIYVVTHFNHPNEITDTSVKAVSKLVNSGVIMANQTVLLKGVNDNPDTLINLMSSLAAIGVTPYYLFQCRPVKRVKHHFQLPLVEGCEVVERARASLNGIAKRFKFIMSHKMGKIEIIGRMGNELYLKYHQSKYEKNHGRFFKMKLTPETTWFDELS